MGILRGNILGGNPLGFEGEAEPTVRHVTVDYVRFVESPSAFETGAAGSTLRLRPLLVGDEAYLWASHAASTPAGVVQTGPDPGDFLDAFPSLEDRTGYEVELPAGTSTPEEVAALFAAVLETIPGVTSATPRAEAESDDTWVVDVETELAISWYPRAWSASGVATGNSGLHGGHIYRMPRSGAESVGYLHVDAPGVTITRPLAQRLIPLPPGAIVWAAQMAFGAVVDTSDESRPRIQYWHSASDDSPVGSETFDFGQVPASQVVAGQAGTIYLTAQQCRDFRDWHEAAAGDREWIHIHSNSGCEYIGAPVGNADLRNEQVNANLVVETQNSTDPEAVLTTWDDTDPLNFAYLIGARLCYETDPCGTFEHHERWGTLSSYAQHGDDIEMPDTVTAQTAPAAHMVGARILRGAIGGDGDMRVALGTGGTSGDDDPDSPSLIGATTIYDFEVIPLDAGEGEFAPDEGDVIRVPETGLWVLWKGRGAAGAPGADGRGELIDDSPFENTGRPNQPSSWIRRTGAGIGTNPGEVDIARDDPGYGNAAVAFQATITDDDDTEFQPDNHPDMWLEVGCPDLPVT